MNRVLAATVLASVISLGLVACGDEQHGHGGMGGMGGGGGPGVDYAGACEAYTTCDTCTPVLGCGWCFQSDGTGTCASGPARCSGQEFSWTWEPSGCGTSTADGGTPTDAPVARDATPIGPSDASPTEVSTDDAAPADAPQTDAPTVDAAPATDAPLALDAAPACNAPATGSAACVQTLGGTLCAATEATIACHGSDPASTPAPVTAAACRPVSGPAGAGAVFYCCPCVK